MKKIFVLQLVLLCGYFALAQSNYSIVSTSKYLDNFTALKTEWQNYLERNNYETDEMVLSAGGGNRAIFGPSNVRSTTAFSSVTSITPVTIGSIDTQHKPQGKVWYYGGKWWAALPPSSGGLWIFRLDGTTWTQTTRIATGGSRPDCWAVGDLVHILQYKGSGNNAISSFQYDGATDTYKPWSLRPGVTNVSLPSGVETATLAVDGTGKMWVAADGSNTVVTYWSNSPYTTWSSAITIGTGISSDDICSITKLPGKIGVFWSNQTTGLFGFKTHDDGAAPTVWSADETPASQSAISGNPRMADDHINVAVGSDGTVYVVAKTSYNNASLPQLILLVRQPSGVWDNLRTVTMGAEPNSDGGTQAIILLNEVANKLRVVYTSISNGGQILYKEASTSGLTFGSSSVLMGTGSANYNFPSSTHQNYHPNVPIIATNQGSPRQIVSVIASDAADAISPTATSIVRSSPTTQNTSATSVVFAVSFSEAVTGVGSGDFSLTTGGTANGVVGNVSGSGSDYTVTVNNITGTGSVRLDLDNAGTGIEDVAGNPIAGGFTSGETYNVSPADVTAPDVTSIVRSNPTSQNTNATSVIFEVTFSESVTGVGTADFSLTETGTANGTVSSFSGSGSTYLVTVNAITGTGSLRLDLDATGTGIEDQASNPIAGGFTSGETYNVSPADVTAPDVTSIVRSNPTSQNTNATSVIFEVTFSESVTGVGTADFSLTETGTANGTVSSFSGSGSTYLVTVNAITGTGSLRLDLDATGTGIEDQASNPIAGGFTSGETYNVSPADVTAPDVTSIVRSNPTSQNTNATSVIFEVTFSESVTGVGTADFSLTETGTANGTISSFSGSGSTYFVTVNAITGTGSLRLDLDATGTGIEDQASNPIAGGFTSGETYNVSPADVTAPDVTSIVRSNPTSQNTNATSVIFEVTFSESVTGVGTADFSLTETGTANGTVSSFSGSGSTYLVTVNAITGTGSLRLDLDATGTGIEDQASNPIAGGFTSGETYNVSPADVTAPDVTSIVRSNPTSQNTNATSVIFEVTFSESVTGVGTADFSLTETGTANGTISSFSGSGSTYFVTVNAITGTGSLRLDLDATGTGIEDQSGNPIAGGFTSGETYNVSPADVTAPDVTSIVRSNPTSQNTSATSVIFEVTFSESVTGVGTADFSLTETGTANGTVSSFSGSGSTYLVTVNAITGTGSLRLDLDATGTGIEDQASNPIAGGFTSGETYNVSPADVTAPDVTSIVRSNPTSQNTNATSVIFEVTFSESVTGVGTADFSLTETGTASGTISSFSGSGSTYFVTVNAITGTGSLRLDLDATGTGIEDQSGNPIAGGFTSGETYNVSPADVTAPDVTSIVRSNPTSQNTSATSVIFEVTFSESVTGVGTADFSLTETGTANGTISSFSGSGSTYLVTVNAITGTGSLRLDLDATGTGIEDQAGNPIAGGFTSGETYNVSPADVTAPDVTSIVRSNPTSQNTSATSVIFEVTFSESVTGVGTADFSLTETGTANGTISSFSGSGSTYFVTVNAITGTGSLRLDLDATGTGIEDQAGNPIAGGFTSGETYNVSPADVTAPDVTSIVRSNPTSQNTSATSVVYEVTFSESVTGVGTADFSLTETGTATGTISSFSGSGSTYFVTVNAITGTGSLRLDLDATGTGIEDQSGNPIAGGFTSGETYNVSPADVTAPDVTSIVRSNPTSQNTNATSVIFEVTFSESVTGVGTADFSLTETGTASGTISSFSGSGSTYFVTVNAITGTGSLRLNLDATGTGIEDQAGNPIAGGFTSGETYNVSPADVTAPDVTSIVRSNPTSQNTSATSVIFEVTFSESVTGVGTADFSLTETGTASGTISSFSGSGSTYFVTVNAITGTGSLRLDLDATGTGIEDQSGNPIAGGFTSGETYNVSPADVTAPDVTSIVRSNPTSQNTSATSVVYEVTFSESVTGVGTADFSLTETGTASGTISSFSGSGSTYFVTVNAITGTGSLRLDLDATGTGIEDQSGNPIAEGFTSGETYNVSPAGDVTAPAIASILRSSPTEQQVTVTSVVFEVNFTEAVNGVDASDFLLHTPDGVSATITTLLGACSNYTVTVSNISGSGMLRLDLKSSSTSIVDAHGNPISSGYTTGEYYIIEDFIASTAVLDQQSTSTSVDSTLLMNADADSKSSQDIQATVYPNPFFNEGTFRFTLKETGKYVVRLFDSRGYPVLMLEEGIAIANIPKKVRINGTSLAGGLYIVSIQTNKHLKVLKLVKD